VASSGGTSATTPIGSRAEAEGFVAMVCFKHGPPLLHGVELEWTVHHADDPRRPLDAVQ
jgi:glutamate--cysteine ligase